MILFRNQNFSYYIYFSVQHYTVFQETRKERKKKIQKTKKKHNPYVVLFTCKKNKNIFEFTALFILPTIQRRRGYNHNELRITYLRRRSTKKKKTTTTTMKTFLRRYETSLIPSLSKNTFLRQFFFIFFFLLFNVNIFFSLLRTP